ncbi:MAG: RagB/SusD family nutrient uptake outer membrane protein, partial [Prevotellaceae bacterium]|nr:RagB/SusD family nutrient uptake outer membrane protein [Prevotellaceae bacterium]
MKSKIIIFISAILLIFTSCDDLLDRPQLTSKTDENFWKSETDLRYYCNEYYTYFFVGYSVAWGGAHMSMSPMIGFLTNDDIMVNGTQRDLEVTIPSSRGTTSMTSDLFIESYTGPTWNFSWVRKTNLILDRINTRMEGILSNEAKNHWIGIARFFRGMEYANLVRVFGDVPFYNKELDYNDLDDIYKSRDPRNLVMDSVYNDLKFAFANVRLLDDNKAQNVNRYIVAAYISRLMLCEGTWQKYYYNNPDRAKKFLEFAVEAGNFIINSEKYSISEDYRSLFGSDDLSGSKECILFRTYAYAAPADSRHCVATYCNMREVMSANANLDLVKAFICQDGQVYQYSSLSNADKFDIENLVKTRDPRFEATFWNKPTPKAASAALYTCKFINREGPEIGVTTATLPDKYGTNHNENDAPIMRYAEVLLNWIEAKAELETLGGTAISQSDIDISINAIRNRPLASEAIAKGVQKTTPMTLANLPNDPNRDQSVPTLIWEIRRERRMEMFWEYSRLVDLRRWKKLDYMDETQNPDLIMGIWVDIPADMPEEIRADNSGKLAVVNAAGEKIVYDGTNASQLIGYYSPATVKERTRKFLNISGINIYLAPIGENQQADYKARGYELKQTEG